MNQRSLIRRLSFIGLTLFLVAATFAAGFLFSERRAQANRFELLDEARGLIARFGYKDLPPKPVLEYGLIRGMLQAYDDPHTVFLDPPQNELESNRLSGSYGGIGAQIEQEPGGHWLLYPFPNSPASKAGLKDGDRLLAVDTLTIEPSTPRDNVLAALRGPVGTQAALSVARAPEYTAFAAQIERAEIPLPSVTYRLAIEEPRLGLIRVNWMAATTSDEIVAAVNTLQQRGASHFALDLRDNPGGLLDSGVNIARLFLNGGVVLEQQYRNRPIDRFEVEEPGPLADIPLVVLINQGSASAAEIAAGALKAQKRAQIIGQRSYGKDTIQLVYTLADGSSMHITAAHWWIPGLEPPIGGQGVQPDVVVSPPADAADGPDVFIQAAIEALF